MKYTRVVITAFSITTCLSLIIGAFVLFNVKDVNKYANLANTGKHLQESLLEMEAAEKSYLQDHREDVLEDVRDRIGDLRELLAHYEKDRFAEGNPGFLEFDVWEEALNLYERLLDQFVLYHRAVEKSIADIRALEKSILAVIYSKMNPERGIIALQEIRIHEKGFLLYRNYPNPPDERSFEDKRKEAVTNLLVWAQDDRRIEELMERDNQLFSEIMSNYDSQDNTLLALKRERGRMREVGKRLFEESNKRQDIAQRRSVFLCTVLLAMWAIVALAIVSTRFR